ncbi:hypothetical protein PoB_006430700 [Plakobranchus ocellatus]|uniref:Uncharacterized protein n=1 Tax=Plakobranchus ocellatus TaxID=259542 RepID=A0AAV4D0V4_9GAST|nr:hypothetical protein PoB_006430700 [Plakobranchus ocellatus]
MGYKSHKTNSTVGTRLPNRVVEDIGKNCVKESYVPGETWKSVDIIIEISRLTEITLGAGSTGQSLFHLEINFVLCEVARGSQSPLAFWHDYNDIDFL